MTEKITVNTKKKENPKISIDTSIEDMVKYDEAGELLFFEGGEKFLELPESVVSELSKMNRIRYAMAKKEWESDKVNNEEDRWKHQIAIAEQFASPRERMKVKNADPNFSYYLSSPARLQERTAMGYSLVGDTEKEAVGLHGGNTLKTLGQEELVLMKIPKEAKAKLDAYREKRNAAHLGDFDANVLDVAEETNIKITERENN